MVTKLTIAEKVRRRKELGLPEPSDIGTSPFNSNPILRPLLRIPGESDEKENKRITIMTYNVLAQSLIRRQMFPFSGTAYLFKSHSRRGAQMEIPIHDAKP